MRKVAFRACDGHCTNHTKNVIENIHRRSDLVLENTDKKTIIMEELACTMDVNVHENINQKIRTYEQLCFEICEQRLGLGLQSDSGPLVIGYCGGGGAKLLQNLSKLLDDPKTEKKVSCEMIKIVLFESKSILRKILSRLIQPSN